MRNTDNAFKTLRQLKHRHPMPQFQRTVKLQNDISAVVGFAKPDVAAIKKNRYRFSAFFSFGKRQSTDLGQKAADIRKRGIQFRRQQGTGFAVDNIAAGRFVKTERNFALTATKSHGGAAASTVGDKHRLTKGKIRLYAGKNPPECRRLGFPVLFFGHPASQAAAADFGIGTGHVYFKSSSSKPRIG